jgi:catechol 2,3-dioxygenase-like lactoylglutathione lyase family enzyme
MKRPNMKIAGTVLSTRDARALASFYERLLGWPRRADEEGWVIVRADGEGHGLSFHEDVEYVPPVWPSTAREQQMMMHLDIGTDDMDAAVAHAIECGATEAAHQPQDGVRVMLDPDGHPFCLFPSQIW